MKKYLFTNKLWLASLVALFIVTASAIGTYLAIGKNQVLSTAGMKKTTNLPTKRTEEITEQAPKDLKTLNFLLLGYGGPGHQGGYLTDVIQIAHFNFEKNLIALISIPRDLWVELPNGSQAKINQAFTLGDNPAEPVKSGGQVSKEMASIVTGLPIDYFIAVDFVGFKRAIGINLGGIKVNVPETLEDPWYPIKGEELNPCGHSPEEIAQLTNELSGFELEKQFECRYEHLLFKKGMVQMEGGDALKYVRSRHGSSAGDFSRSQRQHAVLKGIKNKLFSLEALDDVPGFFKEVSQNTTTDIDLKIAKYLAPAIKSSRDFEIKSLVISTDNVLTSSKSSSGQFILIPKAGSNQWQEIHNLISSEI